MKNTTRITETNVKPFSSVVRIPYGDQGIQKLALVLSVDNLNRKVTVEKMYEDSTKRQVQTYSFDSVDLFLNEDVLNTYSVKLISLMCKHLTKLK